MQDQNKEQKILNREEGQDDLLWQSEMDSVEEEEMTIWKQSSEINFLDKNAVRHDIKIKANQLTKECQKAGIPMFFAYYNPEKPEGKRYQYAALFPEEVAPGEEARSEMGKFKEFLRVVLGFNRADYETKFQS